MATHAGIVAAIVASAASGAALGCDAADSGTADWRVGWAAEIDAQQPAVSDPGIDEEACQRIAAEAIDYLDSVMDCSTDAACDVRFGQELVEDPCLPMLVCYVPVAAGADLDQVAADLGALDREYRESCGVCPTAMCIDPDRMFSTCEEATCELGVAPPADAFTI
jgi:hypothetical protein